MSTIPTTRIPVTASRPRTALVWIEEESLRRAVTARLLGDGFLVAAPGDPAAEQVAPAGPLDVLVAAVTEPVGAPSLEADAGEWLRAVSAGLHEPFGLIRDALPQLRESEGARVVVIGRGWSAAQEGSTASAALNGGLVALVKTLARDLGAEGIAINEIAVPVGAVVTGEVIASAVSYLAGTSAASVLGQVLTVGGMGELRP